MNIKIDYNPTTPLTSLEINNNPNDTIYGALFPVRRYPMQAWLHKNGPWEGLLKVLRDITRGRQFTLTFVGRELDFNDIKAAFVDIDAELIHISAYENSDEQLFVKKVLNLLKESKFLSQYPNREISAQLKPLISTKINTKVNEFVSIEQLQELLNAIKSTRSLILINSDVFQEAAESIKKSLYGNFKRPADSVAIRVLDEKEALKYSYAREYGINIVTFNDIMIDTLTHKYSVPQAIGEEYIRFNILAKCIDEILKRQELLRERNSDIKNNCDEKKEDEYAKNSDEIRWITRNKANLIKIRDLILDRQIQKPKA